MSEEVTVVDTAESTESQIPANTSETTVDAELNNAQTDEAKSNEEVVDADKNQQVQDEERKKVEKRASGVQKRIDELTRDKYAERQARENLERQNQELLALIKGNKQASNFRPETDGPPTPDQFPDYQEFIRADAIWHATQKAQQLLEERQKVFSEEETRRRSEESERAIASRYISRQREIAKTIPDFNETIEEGAADVTVPNSVFDIMRKHPDGPLLTYHFIKKPELTEQFFTNPPELHGVLLGQLLSTIKQPSKTSNAPAPGKPVQTKTVASSEPPENTDAYMAWASKNMR